MKIIAIKAKNFLKKIWVMFIPEIIPILEIMIPMSALKFSDNLHQSNILGLCFLFVESSFSLCNIIPSFMRKMYFLSPIEIQSNKRVFPVSFITIFLLFYFFLAIVSGGFILIALQTLGYSADFLAECWTFLLFFTLTKCIEISKDMLFQFVPLCSDFKFYEIIVFFSIEYALLIHTMCVEKKNLFGFCWTVLIVKTCWFLFRFFAILCQFRAEFIFSFSIRNVIPVFFQQSINLMDFYMQKSLTYLNIKYTVVFFLYYEKCDQFVVLTFSILLFDFYSKFGNTVRDFLKPKLKNLLGFGKLETVYLRANEKFKLLLFIVGVFGLLLVFFSYLISLLFEIGEEHQALLSLSIKIIGICSYSFICNPVLFMLLKINGEDSIGFSSMSFLENRFRFVVSVPIFFFFSQYGLLGVVLSNLFMDIFMSMLLFRTYHLYFILKNIISKPEKADLEEELV